MDPAQNAPESRAAAIDKAQSGVRMQAHKLLKELNDVVGFITEGSAAAHDSAAAAEQDKIAAVRRLAEANAAAHDSVAAARQDKIAALARAVVLERALKCALDRAAAAELAVHQLKEQLQQSSADAAGKPSATTIRIRAGGSLHSTIVLDPKRVKNDGSSLPASAKPSIRIDLTKPTAAELELELTDALNRLTAAERDLTDALNRAAAAEQRTMTLHRELHEVEVFSVDTNRTEQVVRKDVEPAPNRLRRLLEGSSDLQARAAKAQVIVKQEKAEVANDLDVSN